MSFFKKLTSKFTKEKDQEEQETYTAGMKKTRKSFTDKINDLMARYRQVDEDVFEELEEVLILSDVGINTVLELIGGWRFEVRRSNMKEAEEVIDDRSEKRV